MGNLHSHCSSSGVVIAAADCCSQVSCPCHILHLIPKTLYAHLSCAMCPPFLLLLQTMLLTSLRTCGTKFSSWSASLPPFAAFVHDKRTIWCSQTHQIRTHTKTRSTEFRLSSAWYKCVQWCVPAYGLRLPATLPTNVANHLDQQERRTKTRKVRETNLQPECGQQHTHMHIQDSQAKEEKCRVVHTNRTAKISWRQQIVQNWEPR